jgi:hypothetical protein
VLPGNNGAFYAVSAGNIDNDATIDTWAISTMTIDIAANGSSGSEAEATSVPAGTPANNIDDSR